MVFGFVFLNTVIMFYVAYLHLDLRTRGLQISSFN
jgi:hypothetical protein